MPRGNNGEDFRTIAEPWVGWRSLEGRIWANPSTLVLKEKEAPELWPKQSARPVTPAVIHDQVGTSARRQVSDIPPARGPAR